MTNDTATKLRPVAHDDFETVHPDELIAHLSQAPILKIGVISLGLHVAMIVLLSIGNFAMCAKYKTFSVTGAVAEHAAALQDQKAAAKKAERSKTLAEQKAKRDAQAKIDAEKEPKKDADAAEKPAREKSAIEKELEETSSERPTESSMTLDDMDDGL
jgi:flagellar biosynthesis GTPase FlhF